MRNIFIAGSKIFGLFQACYCLYFMGQVMPLFRVINFSIVDGALVQVSGIGCLLGILHIAWVFLISIALAWFFIFKAEWLADKLKIPESSEMEGLSKEAFLVVGIILLGLYVTAQAAPALVSALLQSFKSFEIVNTTPYELRFWIFNQLLFMTVVPAFKLLFGLLFIFKVNKITAWLRN